MILVYLTLPRRPFLLRSQRYSSWLDYDVHALHIHPHLVWRYDRRVVVAMGLRFSINYGGSGAAISIDWSSFLFVPCFLCLHAACCPPYAADCVPGLCACGRLPLDPYICQSTTVCYYDVLTWYLVLSRINKAAV